MLTTHAVGIDLGTTYSSIAFLNAHGEPVTLANSDGELTTPSVVFFDGDEILVGTEALRNAIVRPERVVQNAKRYMGDAEKRWVIDEKPYSSIDISALILKRLIGDAQAKIGTVEQAVITVPAPFSEGQRHATIEAGHRAGLKQVEIINEPVAAALCHVLGSQGIWFTELAKEQKILVFDLGGGTFDLSLVSYRPNEVTVLASSGDLQLGGIDWNEALIKKACKQFFNDFGMDPRDDPSSLQALSLEVEQTKRSLSARPRATLNCQHMGRMKAYQITLEQFEKLTGKLAERTFAITKQLLKDQKIGWAHIDVVLMIGGGSRMPMIRRGMKKLSGRTLNTSLSPDLSIAHGATYYAGMLLTHDKFARSILNPEAAERLSRVRQQSVNARALGIVARGGRTDQRIAHYLIPANTPLPAKATHDYGTVTPNQQRVALQIIESGTAPDELPVLLGTCTIDSLPPDLPENSMIEVTISYDEAARVHVSARDKTGGKEASAEIIRQENLLAQLAADGGGIAEAGARVDPLSADVPPSPFRGREPTVIPLRDEQEPPSPRVAPAAAAPAVPATTADRVQSTGRVQKKRRAASVAKKPAELQRPPRKKSFAAPPPVQQANDDPSDDVAEGEDEFWKLVE